MITITTQTRRSCRRACGWRTTDCKWRVECETRAGEAPGERHRNEMKNLAKVVCWLACGGATVALAASRGDEGVVIYNSRMPESRGLAFYYAKRRDGPNNQVFGFDLATTGAMKRDAFPNDL